MTCPVCKRPVGEEAALPQEADPTALLAPHYPFCSERCKLIDLGNWASESYVISTPVEPGPETAPREGPPDDNAE